MPRIILQISFLESSPFLELLYDNPKIAHW